jgi:hypothetical protein
VNAVLLDGELLRMARLAWWLGPWSGRAARPGNVLRRPLTIDPADGGPSFVYTPTNASPHTAWLISPGLHHDGPDDPRMDRFAAALASAGGLVLSPRSPALCGLQLSPAAITCLARAHTTLARLGEASGLPMRVVSVSIGALAALRLAAVTPTVERVVVIGGYADPEALMASLCGADAEPRDPLNQPTAFLTFLDHLPVAIHDRTRLVNAWRWFVRTAWPRESWKRPGATAHHDAARTLAREVDARDRELFLVGCGARPGGHALIRAAHASGAYAHLDWRPHAATITAEVIAVHGTTDNVIPIGQLDALAAALPAARTIRLGAFAHSKTTGSLGGLARDASALGHMLRAMA